MIYKGVNIDDCTLDELELISTELALQEAKHNEAMKHPKFQKIKPVPTLGTAFVNLRQAIKHQIESKRNAD